MASPAPQAVQQTVRRWLADYIVGLRLCPYAAPVLQQTLILQARPQQSPAEAVTAASTVLSNDPTTTAAPVTALVVLPQRRYRRLSPFVRAAEAADQALATVAPHTKLAFFHPRMQHTAGSEAEQPEDFAGRGPFPMLHVLRVGDLVRVESQGLPHGQQGAPRAMPKLPCATTTHHPGRHPPPPSQCPMQTTSACAGWACRACSSSWQK